MNLRVRMVWCLAASVRLPPSLCRCPCACLSLLSPSTTLSMVHFGRRQRWRDGGVGAGTCLELASHRTRRWAPSPLSSGSRQRLVVSSLSAGGGGVEETESRVLGGDAAAGIGRAGSTCCPGIAAAAGRHAFFRTLTLFAREEAL